MGTFLDASAHEANRISHDRLVGAEPQDHFDSMLRCGNKDITCPRIERFFTKNLSLIDIFVSFFSGEV